MQTIGMGAAISEENSDGKLVKENKELKETMNRLIAENEALHTRIGDLETDLKEALEEKPVDRPVDKPEEPETGKSNKK